MEQYKQLQELPGMNEVGKIWTVQAREKRLNGLVTISTETEYLGSEATQTETIPARYLQNGNWFERQWELDAELFSNSFYQWLELHGCKPLGGYPAGHYKIDMNELKSAIQDLTLD